MTTKKPNILLLICDQLRQDALGCYGNNSINTPNIDQLCEEGVRFDRAIATDPICVPARPSILAGRYAHTFGGKQIEGVTNITHLLKAQGYHTAALGKMHFVPPRGPFGFDYLRLSEDTGVGRFQDDYQPYLANKNLQEWTHGLDNWDLMWSTSPLSQEDYVTTWNGDTALEYLERTRPQDMPFFGVVSFVKPHPPFDPPKPFNTMYNYQDMPPAYQPEPLHKRSRNIQNWSDAFGFDGLCNPVWNAKIKAHYYGLVTQIDEQIGRIIASLKAQNLYDNTIIIFLSDHGEMLGDQYLFMKHYPYFSCLKIPLIVKWHELNTGSYQGWVNQADILPTLCELLSIETPEKVTGESLFNFYTGTLKPRNTIYAAHVDGRKTWGTIIDDRYKYHFYSNGAEEELFEYNDDFQEEMNLAQNPEYRQICSEMKSRLTEWVKEIDGTREPEANSFLENGELKQFIYKPEGFDETARNRYLAHRLPKNISDK